MSYPDSVYQHPIQPGFPAAGAAPPKPARPASVSVAFYLVIGAALGWGMVLSAALWQLSAAANLMEDAADKVGATQAELDTAFTAVNAVNVVESIIAGLMLLALVLLGIFAYRGGNAVRWVLVSLLGLSSLCCCGGVAFSLAQDNNSNATDTAGRMVDEYSKLLIDREPVVFQAFSLIGPLMLVVLGLAGLVLLVVPVSNRYFRKVVDPALPVIMGPDGYPVYYGGPSQYSTSAPPAYYPPYPGAPPPYPTSGPPQYPTSGPPQYPTSGPPQYPTSGPPQYPTSGPPQYPTSGPPQYPSTWPPPGSAPGPGWPQAGTPGAWPQPGTGTPQSGAPTWPQPATNPNEPVTAQPTEPSPWAAPQAPAPSTESTPSAPPTDTPSSAPPNSPPSDSDPPARPPTDGTR